VARVETPVTAARGLEVSARRFRQIAFAAVAMLLLVVATGATVRLTASGLGCESWPGCEDRYRLPEQSFHSYVEFGNRVIAFLTILATLVAGVASVFVATLPRWAKALAWATFAGTLAQAPLGAITIHYHLNPWLVLSHFLLSIVVLTAGVVLLLEAWGAHVRPFVPTWVRVAAAAFGVACITMVVTGTLATAAGPHPGSREGVRRLGNFQTAVEVHVRATAAFGILLLVLCAYLWRARRRSGRLPHATLAVLALVCVQMAVGEIQYRNQLPWWLVLAHVTLAATVWASVVALVVSYLRPPAALAPGRP
jgi:cytochrome c oxidase assembly protein subunit 15